MIQQVRGLISKAQSLCQAQFDVDLEGILVSWRQSLGPENTIFPGQEFTKRVVAAQQTIACRHHLTGVHDYLAVQTAALNFDPIALISFVCQKLNEPGKAYVS